MQRRPTKGTSVNIARLIAVAAVAALLAVPPATAATPKLVGTVGPGFTITLTKGGKRVTAVAPGK